MEGSVVRRFRLFFVWQDEDEERWLSEMASEEGLHLASVSWPGFYTFLRDQPRRDVYRLDYPSVSGREWADYLRSLQDAGWEYVGQMANWRYFRHAAAEGETPELYADAAAKEAKYKRVLALYVVLMPAWILVLTSSIWHGSEPVLRGVLRLVIFALMMLWVYAAARLIGRVNALRKR